MNLDKYWEFIQTRKGPGFDDPGHLTLGFVEELGEVSRIFKKVELYGRELDREALKLEVGDLVWYTVASAKANGVRLFEPPSDATPIDGALGLKHYQRILAILQTKPEWLITNINRYLCLPFGFSVYEAMQANKEKLEKRHPNGFSAENKKEEVSA